MKRSRLMNIYIQRMTNELAKEGERLVKKARDSKKVGNISFNQNDAFGYIVYFEGRMVRHGYANPTPMSTGTHRGYKSVPDGTGRQWLDDFMQTYKPTSQNFVLVIVNAAFYSGIHEAKDYRIISQVYSDLETFGSRFKGSTIKMEL